MYSSLSTPAFKVIALTLVLISLSGFIYCPAGLAKTEDQLVDGFEINQICKTVGDQLVIVTGDAIKVKHAQSGLVAIYKAPYKEALFYNSLSKKSISLPLSKYVSPYAYSWNAVFNRNISDIPLTKVGPVTFKNMDCMTYRSSDQFTAAQLRLRKSHDLPARSIEYLTYTVTKKFTGSPGSRAQNLLLQKIYGLPEIDGTPLQLTFQNFHAAKKFYLTTAACKPIKVKRSEFDRPPGLVPAANIEAVTTTVNAGFEMF